jgi:hypothetical protein
MEPGLDFLFINLSALHDPLRPWPGYHNISENLSEFESGGVDDSQSNYRFLLIDIPGSSGQNIGIVPA